MIISFWTAILSWLLTASQQTRHALQWWHQRQVSRLHDGAELIRDGVLQELFAIRRTLELGADEHDTSSQTCLQQLEALHQTLEQISNELSPAYIKDSLPLAMKYMLQQWQTHYARVKLTIQLPSNWTQATTPSGRVVLTVLEELLDSLAPDLGSNHSIHINLTLQETVQEQTATLTIQLVEPNGIPQPAIDQFAHLKEVTYLRRAFECLTAGHSSQTVNHSSIQWQFCWSIVAPANND